MTEQQRLFRAIEDKSKLAQVPLGAMRIPIIARMIDEDDWQELRKSILGEEEENPYILHREELDKAVKHRQAGGK